jgi:hypothetical protein
MNNDMITKIGNEKFSFVSIVAGLVTPTLTTPIVLISATDPSGMNIGNPAGKTDKYVC